MSKSRPIASGKATPRPKAAKEEQHKEPSGKATRETIESIVVAVILAFLFRAFIAEAFVIPTGSMAPTLQGRHMDVECEECGFAYRTGASCENKKDNGAVVASTCPICRYTMILKKKQNPNQSSFNGDRILVSKFTYEFSEPKRWDVIVFKFPGNAKQNYIKRLVGLPNETILIRHGDVYARNNKEGDGEFHIERKEPYKLRAMQQLVHDTDYQSPQLTKAGWPPRWKDWKSSDAPVWRKAAGGRGFETVDLSNEEAWLRYRHVVPWNEDWEEIGRSRGSQRLKDGKVTGELVTDHYAYNDGIEHSHDLPEMSQEKFLDTVDGRGTRASGLHWVGDLAIECDVDVKGDSGQLSLDLVEGGVHYTCRIDLATGQAVLSIDDGRKSFIGHDGKESRHPTGKTKIDGSGSYRLRLSNCDDEVLLWVNNRVIEFNGPTTYRPAMNVKPKWSPDDAGDLEPAGVGAKGVELEISGLRLYRDVYYVASSYRDRADGEYEQSTSLENEIEDYQREQQKKRLMEGGFGIGPHIRLEEYARKVLRTREDWSTTSLFDARRKDVEFDIGEDQFFPLGDNSPQSRDARVWSVPNPGDGIPFSGAPPKPYVGRELLTGKALLIYWPHSWRRPVPFLPNIKRMGLIR